MKFRFSSLIVGLRTWEQFILPNITVFYCVQNTQIAKISGKHSMNTLYSRTSFAPSSILPVWVRPSFSIIMRRGRAHLFHSPYLYFSGPETTLCLLPRPNMATCRLEWEWTALVLLRPRSDLPHFFFSSRLPSCYNAEPYATDRPPARMPDTAWPARPLLCMTAPRRASPFWPRVQARTA